MSQRGSGRARDVGGRLTLSTPGVSEVTVPPGHLVDFVVIGGGGAGGHGGGHHGNDGVRIRGTIAPAAQERTLIVHCGEGGHVDSDDREGDPTMGGAGGTGYVPGSVGGWSGGPRAGGGGGGGGASAILIAGTEVRVVASGGGGGGGGGADPAAPQAVAGRDGSSGARRSRSGDAVEPGRVGLVHVTDAGGNGTTRRRIAGGGGGGGGGGSPAGSGGEGGSGGGTGGQGGDGGLVIGGPIIAFADPVGNAAVDRSPGTGGRGGTAGPGGDDRPATPGADGEVRLHWAPVDRVRRPGVSGAAVYYDRPVRSDRVIASTVPTTSATVLTFSAAPSLELSATAAALWTGADGRRTIAELAQTIDVPTEDDAERESIVGRAVALLREHGYLEPQRIEPGEGRPGDAPFGYGIDLVGSRYALRQDPSGRPESVDLLRAVFREGTAARSTLDALVEALRASLGRDQLIWACKHVAGRLRLEFYLFASMGGGSTTNVAELLPRVIGVFEEFVPWPAPRRFDGDPVLVSFEFEIDTDGTISVGDTIDVSHNVPAPGILVVNYESDRVGTRLKSIAQGFDVERDRTMLAERLGSARGAGSGCSDRVAAAWLARIDEIRECEICWVSYKANSDGVYFSRTHVDDLIVFLDEHAYPDHLRDWATAHRSVLDHLRFDLCYDYRVTGAEVHANRTAFCGWL